MLFPPDRKLARTRGLWPRLVATVGLVAFSCTFPDYRFDTEPAETCDNDIHDGNETGIDCGGDCDPCPCQDDDDCPGAGEVCEDGDCHEPCENGECQPTCTDDKKNGEETDKDCGGPECPKCAIGADCKIARDCVEKVCDEICQPPRCDDGVRNGFESWDDCGGDCEANCANGQPCFVDEDCQSDTCVETAGGQPQCAPPFCSNSKLDPGETDVDCGGRDCPKCGEGDTCGVDGDCIEGVCGDDEKCAAPECDDQVKNGPETDLDCGGGCPTCADGLHCEEAADCKSRVCALPSECDGETCTEKECQEPACNDSVKNGEETDDDCGGDCDGCDLGDGCKVNRDCLTGICDTTSEAAPTCVSCDDDEENGLELGVDCGGPDCPLCQPGDECIADAGCVNYLCDGECVTGLRLDYHCGQCGDAPDDQIKFFVRLNNRSDEPIDVSDVSVRYYFSTDAPASVLAGLDLECEYMGEFRCGEQELLPYANPTNRATHYLETTIGATQTIPAEGSAELEITIRLGGLTMEQTQDYSFSMGVDYHLDWELITLHRQGTQIWGREP